MMQLTLKKVLKSAVTYRNFYTRNRFSTVNFIKGGKENEVTKEKKESDMRNIGIMAHIDAGKTTTTERMLYFSGYSKSVGEVHDGNTVTDYMDQERERGITIQSAAISFNWLDKMINLIDTPGHVDFTIEVERSLRVLDGAVAVFDSSAGVEAQSLTVWLQAERYNVPCIAYLNKMDKDTADIDLCLKHFEDKLNVIPLLTQTPIGKHLHFNGIIDLIHMKKFIWDRKSIENAYSISRLSVKDPEWTEILNKRSNLVEQVADLDNTVAEIVLEKESTHLVSPAELQSAIKRITLEKKGLPIFLGSSYKNVGVELLMNAVCEYLPSPKEKFHPKVDPFIPNLCAVAFKIIHHPKKGPLTFLRIYSGRIHQNQKIYNASKNLSEKVDSIFRVFADEFQPILECSSGSIVVVTGMKGTITGDTLTSSQSVISQSSMDPIQDLLGVTIPEPVFMCSIEAPSLSQQKTLDLALNHLQKEDPTIRISHEEDTGQTIIAGMGELHLQVTNERIRREYKIDSELGPLFISYRETMNDTLTHTVEYDKVIGDSKQSAKLTISLEPHENYQFKKVELKYTKENTENLNSIRPAAIEAVTRGIKSGLNTGPIMRSPVINVKPCLLHYESTRRTSSNVVATAASQCIREILKKAQCVLLEPVMKIEVVSPLDKNARILGELNKRRANVDDVHTRQNMNIIECHCPLVELVGFSSSIRQLSSGLASLSMEFAHYRTMKDQEKQEAIRKMTGLF